MRKAREKAAPMQDPINLRNILRIIMIMLRKEKQRKIEEQSFQSYFQIACNFAFFASLSGPGEEDEGEEYATAKMMIQKLGKC